MPPPNTPKAATSSNTPLSKTAVYQELPTPVADGKPLKHASNPNAILAGRKEAALAEFLEHASQYNFQISKRSRHKKRHNHVGNRPLSKSEYLQYLKGRALTLVGGGFHASEAKVQSKSKKSNYANSSKWTGSRKRQRPSQDGAQTKSATSIPNTVEFLKHINQLWNDYARSVLLRPNATTSTDNSWQLVHSAIAQLEWVGACVRIEHCPAYRHLTGRSGIVVAVTQCTWCIKFAGKEEIMMKDEGLTTGHATSGRGETLMNEKLRSSGSKTKPCHIPKSNTQVSVLLPLPQTDNHSTSEINNESTPQDNYISMLIDLASTI